VQRRVHAHRRQGPQLHVQFKLDPSSSSSTGSRPAGSRPEIDRGWFRRLLAESLPADAVCWGSRLLRVGEAVSGERGRQLRPVLEHTTVGGYDMIVGADDAWSRTARAPERVLARTRC